MFQPLIFTGAFCFRVLGILTTHGLWVVIRSITGNFAIPYIHQKTKGPLVTAQFEFYMVRIILLKTNRKRPWKCHVQDRIIFQPSIFSRGVKAIRFTEYDPLNTFFALDIFFSECPNKKKTFRKRGNRGSLLDFTTSNLANQYKDALKMQVDLPLKKNGGGMIHRPGYSGFW